MDRRTCYTEPFAVETLTVGAVAGGLSAGKYAPVAGGGMATRAAITVETSAIRWWADGTDPTATTGHLAAAGSRIELEGPNAVARFRAIRADAGDATLQVTYER